MYPGRITKAEARKRWDENKDFIIVPCQCRAYDRTIFIDTRTKMNVAQFAQYVCPEDLKAYDTEFDAFVNQFEYYNCNVETGYYAAFYVTWEEFTHGLSR